MWTIFIAFFIGRHVFPKRFTTFLAHERHLRRFRQGMRLFLRMAFSAIIPLLTTWSSDSYLSIQNMLAYMILDCVIHIYQEKSPTTFQNTTKTKKKGGKTQEKREPVTEQVTTTLHPAASEETVVHQSNFMEGG